MRTTSSTATRRASHSSRQLRRHAFPAPAEWRITAVRPASPPAGVGRGRARALDPTSHGTGEVARRTPSRRCGHRKVHHLRAPRTVLAGVAGAGDALYGRGLATAVSPAAGTPGPDGRHQA